MNILIVGNGGREHAIAWKIKKSPLVSRLFVSGDNAGISQIAECISVEQTQRTAVGPTDSDITTDFQRIGKFVKENKIELVIVGPEKPLAEGIIDYFKENLPKIKVFGPNKTCAQLESSKVYMKDVGTRKGIPQAKFRVFTSYEYALKYISSIKFPIVIKADGLAAGKGTFIVNNISDAKIVLKELLLEKKLSDAGKKIVIEEFLNGKEVSYMVLTDNDSILNLPAVRDFKRLMDKNVGPNTGGMGAISPLEDFSYEDELETTKKIILPTLSYINSKKEKFTGVLYAGLMKTEYDIKLLEFNVRFGDPETQVLLPLIKNDLLDIILHCVDGKLKESKIEVYNRFACCVCLVSGGYPGKYNTGYEITGLEKSVGPTTVSAESTTVHGDMENVLIFHAGTKTVGDKVVTNGGRVLNVVGLGYSKEEAIKNAYDTASRIKFENVFYRKDISWDS